MLNNVNLSHYELIKKIQDLPLKNGLQQFLLVLIQLDLMKNF